MFRPDLLDLMLSSRFIENIPVLGEEMRIFICKLSWNSALNKPGYLEKFHLFLFSAEILVGVPNKQLQQAVYISSISAGIHDICKVIHEKNKTQDQLLTSNN